METEKRSRTIVVNGIEEPSNNLRTSERSHDLRAKVDAILDVLNIDCTLSDILRIGKMNNDRPRMTILNVAFLVKPL
ncbi:hypothetical protein OESDEN_15331 [Oesophagostomum dentatum]|uniref:Uncharacterized protein n=1 Tax=Oesophagostomum dentatum TaxID=61180 RepID=A0A0B1SJ51_OESDE|nr:hypothetical protein OESDEN_15331 [Oesophagostomum dentatum]